MKKREKSDRGQTEAEQADAQLDSCVFVGIDYNRLLKDEGLRQVQSRVFEVHYPCRLVRLGAPNDESRLKVTRFDGPVD